MMGSLTRAGGGMDELQPMVLLTGVPLVLLDAGESKVG
jgi:hypothetical protein